jgi:hypothetical protein
MGSKFLNSLRSSFLLEDIRKLLNTPRSSFGEIVSEGLRIQSGWTFPYNLDTVFINQVVSDGGTVTHSGSFAVMQSGTNPAGKAEINTKRALAYTPGVGAVAKFTAVFDTPVANCKQIIGIGNTLDGWFFGYNGLRFGILKINNGAEEWFYQEDWSFDKKLDLIPQNGNVYQIDFQWLGFGAQYFSIEDDNGDVTQVHRIDYANKNTDVSVQNPSLPLTAKVINVGNTTNITLKTQSAIAGSYGELDSSAFEFPVGFDQLEKVTVANVETYLFSLQNPTTFEGKTNRLFTIPTFLSLSSDGSKSVVIRIYFNPTLTAPDWVDLAPGITPLQSDIAATGFSGGLKVLTTTLGKVDRDTIDLSIFRGLVSPGGMITVTALSANASSITTGLTSKSRV